MKSFKNKTITSTLAVLMIMAFTISMIALPGANAQTTTANIVTYPFVDVIPNPVGVGQRALINFGLLNFLAADGDGFNVTVQITHPDGHVETVGPLMTWSTGTVGYSFVPQVAGTYKLQCIYAGEFYNSSAPARAPTGNYLASQSDVVNLVVQEQPVATYPAASMPTEYWTRPIDSQLREWWSIAGSWLYKLNNLYAPYNDAPGSAHILWTMPVGDTMGGLTGGDNQDIGYQNGDAYEGKFAGSIIISGVLYYNRYVSNSPTQTIVAVDLHTGKTLWERSYTFGGSRISTGQTLTWICLNNRGTWSYVWMASGTNMYALDALTGDLKYNMTNVPSGTIYYGPNGEMLKYQITNYGNASNPNWRLLQWNSSYVVTKGKTGMAESWGSQVQGVTYNATDRGYDLNVSIPALTGSVITVFPMDRIVVGRVTVQNVTLSAISLKDGQEGQVLFQDVNWNAPAVWKDITVVGSIGQAGWAAYSAADLVGVYWTKENRVNYAFSFKTGEFLYETAPQTYADAWSDTVTASFGPEKVIAYGRLYEASVGGIVYCYNVTNGNLLWNYTAKDKYTESYITPNWWLVPTFISDGKIYFGHIEHSALEPKPRGAPFFALDAYTGALVWEIDGAFRQTRWGGRAIIGDSIIATMDTYDQQIYGIGKGPTQVTVTTPDVGVAANTAVLIKGTVMDISPGTKLADAQLRFPNGVAAVSEASMSNYMLYVYKQFAQPMDTTGVAVSIDGVDPNGNYIHLGDTTSDASGRFAFSYTPTAAGKYVVYASFAGSESYYGATAQNELVVQAAAQATATPTAVANTPYEMYTIGMGIAIIAVVAIVGLLILRKK